MGLLAGVGLEGPDAYQGPQVNASDYASQLNSGAQNKFSGIQDSALGKQADAIDLSQANQDYQQQQQSRAGLLGAAQNYQDIISGKAGPSLAQLQMKQGEQQALAQQQQVAASARGSGAIATSRAAAFGGALAGQQAAASAASLRAQEVASAQQGLTQTYGALRSGDQGAQGQSFAQAQQSVQNGLSQQNLNNNLAGTYLNGQLQAAEQQTQGNQAGAAAVTAAQQHAEDETYGAQQASDARAGAFVSGIAGAGAAALTGGLG